MWQIAKSTAPPKRTPSFDPIFSSPHTRLRALPGFLGRCTRTISSLKKGKTQALQGNWGLLGSQFLTLQALKGNLYVSLITRRREGSVQELLSEWALPVEARPLLHFSSSSSSSFFRFSAFFTFTWISKYTKYIIIKITVHT